MRLVTEAWDGRAVERVRKTEWGSGVREGHLPSILFMNGSHT